jgi:general secretion pathway protein G
MAANKTNKKRGFTIVELLIVTVVIAILAAITIVAYNGIQARARDGQKRSDMRNIAQLLEVFYNDNGYYPPFSPAANVGISYASWRTTNMPNLKDSLLTPPTASSVSLVNSTTPALDQYGYHNAGTCTGTGAATKCTQVRLYWKSSIDGHTETLTGQTG